MSGERFEFGSESANSHSMGGNAEGDAIAGFVFDLLDTGLAEPARQDRGVDPLIPDAQTGNADNETFTG